MVAGLTVSNEELAPVDPGFANEGGPVWDPHFSHINPAYFDYADRRIQYLIDQQILPAIVGAWYQALGQMGPAKLKKHWRYIIARYAAYPVVWILGGEIRDNPQSSSPWKQVSGWTDIARYVRATDPFARLLTAHEFPAPESTPLQDSTLLDFELMQPSHWGWPSIALEVANLNIRWARTHVTKPVVVGEIGWERIGGVNLEDYQRTAFWLAMLNGAAGFNYGSSETSEAYSADKQFHRIKFSLRTWEEGMNFPGAYQAGLGAKLLKEYPWWRFEPHPEWIFPCGTTLLEPHQGTADLYPANWNQVIEAVKAGGDSEYPLVVGFPAGTWQTKGGKFFLPYAAGVPGEVRVIYIPYYGFLDNLLTAPPTVFGLERGVRYRAFYWEPSLGVKIDLGCVECPATGALILEDRFNAGRELTWIERGSPSKRHNGRLLMSGDSRLVLDNVRETDLVVAVDARADAGAGLILRYQDDDNYVAAVYCASQRNIQIIERKNAVAGRPLGITATTALGADIRISAEVRNEMAAMSITDGQSTYATPIVRLGQVQVGSVGLMHCAEAAAQSFANFELRRSPTLVHDHHLEKDLYDARGLYRGRLAGPAFDHHPARSGWDNYGRNKHILLGAYRPERLPFQGDWVLVMEKQKESTE